MTQGDLFDASIARDEAIDRVSANADPTWMKEARSVVLSIVGAFTTDDVWSRLLTRPHEPRALGAVLRDLQAEGHIEPTGNYVPSTRPECHARPVRQWRRK